MTDEELHQQITDVRDLLLSIDEFQCSKEVWDAIVLAEQKLSGLQEHE